MGYVSVMKQGDKFPSAVESKVMVRKFPSRIEHTVFVMLQIIFKLVRTKSRLFEEGQFKRSGLIRNIAKMRFRFYVACHHLPSKFVDKFVDRILISDLKMDLRKEIVPAISAISSALDTNAGDPFLLWETLKLLMGFLLYSFNCHRDFERMNIKEKLSINLKEVVDVLGTASQFEETWDKVLVALKSGPVHHSSLLDIMCGGSRNQRCADCRKSVTIERVFVHDADRPETILEKPFVTFRRRIFSCPAIDCQMRIRGEEVDFLHKITSMMETKVAAGLENRCDYCGMMGRSMHRCGQCKTKVYCGEECQQLDWDQVHSKICNKGDVARKKKGGTSVRENIGKQEVDMRARHMDNWKEMYINLSEMSDGM